LSANWASEDKSDNCLDADGLHGWPADTSPALEKGFEKDGGKYQNTNQADAFS